MNACTTEKELETNWKLVATLLAEKSSSETVRSQSAVHDHFKEIITCVRSTSQAYSIAARDDLNLLKEPKKDEYVIVDDFDKEFLNYCKSMFAWIKLPTNEDKAKNIKFINSWWDENAWILARKYVCEQDNKQNKIQQQAAEHKNKLDSENEEKARQAQKRKQDDETHRLSQLQFMLFYILFFNLLTNQSKFSKDFYESF